MFITQSFTRYCPTFKYTSTKSFIKNEVQNLSDHFFKRPLSVFEVGLTFNRDNKFQKETSQYNRWGFEKTFIVNRYNFINFRAASKTINKTDKVYYTTKFHIRINDGNMLGNFIHEAQKMNVGICFNNNQDFNKTLDYAIRRAIEDKLQEIIFDYKTI